MTIRNIYNVEEEIVVFLRNNDILTTTERGVTTRTQSFTGDGTTTIFTLGSTPVRNVRGITVAGGSVSFGSGYSSNYISGIVTFATAPTSGGAIAIQYDYGSSDKIFSDYPRQDLTLTSYPRVSAAITHARTSPFGLGGKSFVSDFVVTVSVFAEGTTKVDDIITKARTSFATSGTTFYNAKYIHPQVVSPMLAESERHQKILTRHAEFQILKEVENF